MSLFGLKTRISLYLVVQLTVTLGVASHSAAKQPSRSSQQDFREDLEKASEKLYIEAQRLYNRGDYWEGARDLIILLDFNPEYSKIDQAIIILGDCLYEIGLKNGARKLYRHMVKRYIRSPYLPQALVGLQRIEYDDNNYKKCLEFFQVIKRGHPPDAIFNMALYYAGLCHYRMEQYDQAIAILAQIESRSAYYPHGLYMLGLSHLKLKQVRDALEAFHQIKKLSITNAATRDVVDETYLTTGYIYYELGYYRQALNDFRAVSSSHKNYSKALLAAGWASSKLGAYREAIPPLTELVSIAPQSELAEEGLFLLGRSYLKLDRYGEAERVYEQLIDIFPPRDRIPSLVDRVNMTLKREHANIENIKLKLLMLETKLLDSLPLQDDETWPLHLREERNRIRDIRTGLLRRIQEERKTFDRLTRQMDELEQRSEVREDRRNWRAYAEYGKARASFLRRMEERNQNQQGNNAGY
jgi:tetratricopeptide (TPR) repeat protein